MLQRLSSLFPFVVVLACLVLLSVGCSNVSGDRTPRDAPQASRPCDLPYQDKARPLPAQQDLDKPLDGAAWAQLEAQDAGVYNALWPRFNANIDWSAEHCVAKPATKPTPAAP
jgi:hypothetical protein